MGGEGRGGLRRGGGEEAWALSLALVSLALSSGQNLGIGVPWTAGEGSAFPRNSTMPSSSGPH